MYITYGKWERWLLWPHSVHVRTKDTGLRTDGLQRMPNFVPMTDLKRRLRALYRTTLMLETELRHGHMDLSLIEEIDQRMEQGIGSEPVCAALPPLVDALRESTITPRPELHGDTIRACEKLKDAIAGVEGMLG